MVTRLQTEQSRVWYPAKARNVSLSKHPDWPWCLPSVLCKAYWRYCRYRDKSAGLTTTSI